MKSYIIFPAVLLNCTGTTSRHFVSFHENYCFAKHEISRDRLFTLRNNEICSAFISRNEIWLETLRTEPYQSSENFQPF